MGKKDSKKQKVEVPVKAKKAVVKPVEDSDDESSEEEEVQVKPQKQKGAKPVAKKAESSSEEEESSEEEAPVKNAAKAQESSSEEDDSEEEEAPKLNKQKVQLSKAAVVNQRVVGNKKPVVSKQDDDSSEDTSSEESSEEEVVKKVSTKRPSQTSKPVKKNAAPKKAAKESSEEEDSSEEEEEPSVPVKKAKATKPVKQAAKESSDDDEEDEVSENRKRKKEKANNEPTPKKQKIEAQNGSGEKITLFVGNLSKNTTEEDISAYFTENSITVAEVRKPPNKNNAFVDLEDAEELESALALNGTTLKKSTITVDKAKPRGQKEQNNQSFGSPGDRFSKGGDDDKDSRTLFVKNLPEDATVDGLGTVFDSAADIRLPQRDGVHKGFAFVEFADKESMESAMSEKQGADLNGSSLYLDYLGAKSKNQRGGGRGNDRRGRGGFDGGDRRGGGGNSGVRGESKVLFVKNLSYDTDESSLKSVFEGAVSARVPTFPDSGKPKGFAFVDFTSAEAAAEAYDNMNGQSIDGRQVTLDFAADKGSGGGGFGRGGGGGGFGGRGGGGRGGGFQRGGRGGGFGGRGRGGPRGGGGGFNKARGGIVQSEGRKTKFDDSD